MRKNVRFLVGKYILFGFVYTFLHISKNVKTLDTSGFFEFPTKFSTSGGKLFLHLEKIFLISASARKAAAYRRISAAKRRKISHTQNRAFPYVKSGIRV